MTPHPPRPDALAAPHGFFTRAGGVSTGPFASLNCSLSSADDPAASPRTARRVAARSASPPCSASPRCTARTSPTSTSPGRPAPARAPTPWSPPARHRPRHHHRRLRARPVRRARRGRRRACRLARRPGRRAGGRRGRHGRAQAVHAADRPLHRPASYEVGPTCATPCWPATPPTPLLRRRPARRTGCSTCPATAPPACAPPAPRSACWTPTPCRTSARFFSHRRRTLAGRRPDRPPDRVIACPTSRRHAVPRAHVCSAASCMTGAAAAAAARLAGLRRPAAALPRPPGVTACAGPAAAVPARHSAAHGVAADGRRRRPGPGARPTRWWRRSCRPAPRPAAAAIGACAVRRAAERRRGPDLHRAEPGRRRRRAPARARPCRRAPGPRAARPR